MTRSTISAARSTPPARPISSAKTQAASKSVPRITVSIVRASRDGSPPKPRTEAPPRPHEARGDGLLFEGDRDRDDRDRAVQRVEHRIQPSIADGKRGMAHHGRLRHEAWTLGLPGSAAASASVILPPCAISRVRSRRWQVSAILRNRRTRPPCKVPSVQKPAPVAIAGIGQDEIGLPNSRGAAGQR